MSLSRSSYYYQPVTNPLEEKERADILDRIEAICIELAGYGYRRVAAQLRREGIIVNHKKVLRLMRESDLLCQVKRRWTMTTDSSHGFPVYPNLVKGKKATGINQIWLADITYIRIRRGFVYLAAILDACSRKVIGYAISDRLDTGLVMDALCMAIENRNPGDGVIHHSDQGVQYASHDYTDELKKHGFQISMARKGNPYDNAMMESFFKTLKHEEVYLYEYDTIDDVKARVSHFIEQVYNVKRLHSAIGLRPPEEYEELLIREKQELYPCRGLLTLSVQP
jgi:transposase InsO family protein